MNRTRSSDDRSRSRGRRERTVSISLQDRGQTTQDFAVGIGIFILAVAFVFSFLPTLLAPFDSSVSGAQTAQADRIADRLVENLSVDGEPNTINGTAFEEFDDDEERANRLGLRASDDTVYDRVSITLEHPNGDDVDPSAWTIGDEYDNQSAASSARLVTVENGPDDCEIACRLLVRVW